LVLPFNSFNERKLREDWKRANITAIYKRETHQEMR